uniref:Uncharacterized protein n=1 Tax=viral metagenome TaxID=1070528 RepID=A0A6M3LNL8_9ZZZZ
MSELETRIAGCELAIKEQARDIEQVSLSIEEIRDNHLPHMEARLEKKIDNGIRRSMVVYGIGVAVIGIIVACVGG